MSNILAALEDTEEIDGRIDLPEAIKLRYKHNMSYQQIADRFNVTKQAVHQRLSQITELLPNSEVIEAYRANKSLILEGLEQVLVSKMLDPDKLKDASLNNIGYTFQQVATQNRLEKGLATERIDCFSVTASLSELEKRKQELLKTIRVDTVQPVVLGKDNGNQ